MARPNPEEIADMLGPPEAGPDDSEGADGDLEAVAGDLLEAIAKKDKKALAEALRAAVAMC